MDLSGLIFVVLAIVWAVYLIPKALKQHDEVARTRSVDRFSDETRVVARREPVSSRDARLVVNPRPAAPVKAEASVAVGVDPAGSRARGEGRRTPGRVAARRRLRILVALLLVVLGTAAATYLGYLPRWSPVVPGGLSLAYLLLCRTQARRRRSRPRRMHGRRSAPTPYVAGPVVEPEPVDVPEATAPAMVDVEAEPEAEAAPQPMPEAETQPVTESEALRVPEAPRATTAIPTADSGELWDPVPVTLPTYVTKPKARRTVRTIDLGEAGTWTSGRTPEDAEIAARATDPDAADGQSPKAGQRAVGT